MQGSAYHAAAASGEPSMSEEIQRTDPVYRRRTLRLLAAAPVPDPQEQRRRREAWLAVESEDEQASVPAGVGAGTDLNGGAA